jgi:hypothetical protein
MKKEIKKEMKKETKLKKKKSTRAIIITISIISNLKYSFKLK